LSFNTSETIHDYKLLIHPQTPTLCLLQLQMGSGTRSTQVRPGHWNNWLLHRYKFKPGTFCLYAVTLDDFYRSQIVVIHGQLTMIRPSSEWCRMAISVTPANANYIYLLFGGHVDGTGNGAFSGIFAHEQRSSFQCSQHTKSVAIPAPETISQSGLL
jgi:hypothetical protein